MSSVLSTEDHKLKADIINTVWVKPWAELNFFLQKVKKFDTLGKERARCDLVTTAFNACFFFSWKYISTRMQ